MTDICCILRSSNNTTTKETRLSVHCCSSSHSSIHV